MARPTLYGIFYSPWTQRTRWALDHHRVEVRYREHVPFLGEPVLRVLARGSGRVRASVPLLRAQGEVIGDSLDIMRWADRNGTGAPLFAVEGIDEIAEWIERGLSANRARVAASTLADTEALREAAMAASPAAFAGLLRPLAAQGARFLVRKHGGAIEDEDGNREIVDRTLGRIRETLGGREFVVGEGFSAADMICATFVNGIAPVGSEYVEFKPATRRVWTFEEMAHEYDDLVRWRDGLYARFRRPRS